MGLVTAFEVQSDFLERRGRMAQELWVPAEELDEFNSHIVGEIRLLQAFYGEAYTGEPLL